MKKLILTPFVAIALALAFTAQAEEKTIKGEGMCGKCELKEAKTCVNVIKVKEEGKDKVYYFEHNDISKAFHKNLCSATAKIVAKGSFKEVEGKKVFAATKIDLDK